MKKTFHHILLMTAITYGALCVVSYTQKKFNTNDTIANAKGSALYFENMGLNGLEVLDSVRLGEDGSFTFSEKATDAPEFYHPCMAGQIINVSIDSIEAVSVKAQYPNMASQYEVARSENCSKIKELALTQMTLQQQIQDITQDLGLNSQTTNDNLQKVVEAYKDKVKMSYICKEPVKASSYFILFQTVNVGNGSLLISNPRASARDVKIYATVATSWNTYYPRTERGANLRNIAIEGMRDVRIIQNNQRKMLAANEVATSGLIDIALTDHRGVLRKLTDLKEKVVVFDSHIFASRQSTE